MRSRPRSAGALAVVLTVAVVTNALAADSTHVAPPAGVMEKLSQHAGELLRVRGPFGSFVGTARTIDANGLAELAPRRFSGVVSDTPPQPVAWSRITSVELRTSGAGRGAVVGAVILGTVIAGAAASFTSGFGGSSESATGAGVTGFAIGGVVGAMLGAVIGSASHGWKMVYTTTPIPDDSTH